MTLAKIVWNLLLLSGFVSISYGFYLMHPAAGFITAGVSCIALAVLWIAGARISQEIKKETPRRSELKDVH